MCAFVREEGALTTRSALILQGGLRYMLARHSKSSKARHELTDTTQSAVAILNPIEVAALLGRPAFPQYIHAISMVA